MVLTDAEIAAANARGAARKAANPAVLSVRYHRRVGRVVICLSSGLELAFPPAAVQGLEHARPADLVDAQISPSGLGIRFPRLDADLYLPALLEGFLGSRRWMAAEMGRRGGASASADKAAAARRNGRLGGRPRKVAAQA
ncbi:hypothetical protein LMG31506_02576 [Cupriavidus yeoncheonensis]|uniref:DUF2442 domain-containing protein n=1 Tax=Cupriavidus yeoncheonensis TaxID=1462994 RepID=A0A916IV51_9BURK|nr:DUF2442 domain-containing protein [Cupriavidus yeoncheonensis]CAG2142003.1 hypothetical protein LMG31506_02576 [Cupriavidus yeoncheonensis]